MLIEVDDKHPVFRVARSYERSGGRDHLAQLRPHASAVIDNQSDGHGDVFVPEQPYGLPDAVLVNLKIALAQAGDKAALTVENRGMQHHQVHVH